MKIIDLGLEPPPTTPEIAHKLRLIFGDPAARGVANYRRIFGPRWAAAVGMTLEDIDARRRDLGETEFFKLLDSVAQMLTVSPEAFLHELDQAGIEWALVDSDDIDKTAAFVRRWPDRFKGMALLNPFEGMKAVRQLERAVRELGFVAFYASPFDWKIPANHPLFYPLYAKAAELNIPVFIYTAMNYNTELPMDLARPLNLDAVAMAFPELKIVADCGGWPWVPELVGLARRHKNLYIDLAAHRPKNVAKPGSGFEMLLQFGNTLLQDRILFASSWMTQGLPLKQVIEETMALPLKDPVKEKWMGGNAARVLNLPWPP